MAAAETKRLRALICDLEDQSRETRLELLQTQGRLADLHNYCTQRSKQENAVQQDITHVLGQISGLRVKVVQLEGEKAASETEASTLRRRCRELEDATAERALKLIVERVGASDRAKVHTADSACALDSDATPADQPASESKPAKFAALGSMAISHPEAGEIRAEFNELLHQIIARRDEDIERIQALADGWRSDARKAMHASERKAWSMATRGIQTS
ncbi:hypothetical protein GGI02_003828 [Coemansia sp. RSA 2322]|nr:hypothetical protein GGI02_003828 [Coemansia sp. RSA 2322]